MCFVISAEVRENSAHRSLTPKQMQRASRDPSMCGWAAEMTPVCLSRMTWGWKVSFCARRIKWDWIFSVLVCKDWRVQVLSHQDEQFVDDVWNIGLERTHVNKILFGSILWKQFKLYIKYDFKYIPVWVHFNFTMWCWNLFPFQFLFNAFILNMYIEVF